MILRRVRELDDDQIVFASTADPTGRTTTRPRAAATWGASLA
ncbi:MAG: hypothetical protein R3F61_24025 [Myxococcota bacterium]